MFFASRGQKVTGNDFLAEPITIAKRKAAERGLTATFLVMDALALKALPEVFDSAIDTDPLLAARADSELTHIERVQRAVERVAIVPWLIEEPVGRQHLQALTHAPRNLSMT